MSAVDEVSHCGWLYKHCSSSRNINLQKCYVRLSSGALSYATDDDDRSSTKAHVVPLDECVDVTPCVMNDVYGFELSRVAPLETLHFAAETENDRSDWMCHIRAHISTYVADVRVEGFAYGHPTAVVAVIAAGHILYNTLNTVGYRRLAYRVLCDMFAERTVIKTMAIVKSDYTRRKSYHDSYRLSIAETVSNRAIHSGMDSVHRSLSLNKASMTKNDSYVSAFTEKIAQSYLNDVCGKEMTRRIISA